MRFTALSSIVLSVLLILWSDAAPAATEASVEIQSIQVVPSETVPGKRPIIKASVKAGFVASMGDVREINVIASIIGPDHAVKSWTWRKILMKAGETRVFSIPNEYDVKMGGVYKVEINIYSKDMLPLKKASESFAVVDAAHPHAAPPIKERKETMIVPQRPETVSPNAPAPPEQERNVGVGVSVNAFNPAAGATFLYWPYEDVGLQASYTMGQFTTVEARVLGRFPLDEGITPYAGIGYARVETERTVDVVNIKTTFSGGSASIVAGVELPLARGLFGYVELNDTPLKLKKDITAGGVTGSATVKYSAVSLGFGIVYVLF